MYIERFRVSNYCSFVDTGDVVLQPGFNLVIGQNNVGKTVLLEALTLAQFRSRPHRNSRQSRNQAINPNSILELDLSLTGDELRNILLSDGSEFWMRVPHTRLHGNEPIKLLNEVFQRGKLKFTLKNANVWAQADSPPPYLLNMGEGPYDFCVRLRPLPDRSDFAVDSPQGGHKDSIWELVRLYAERSIYRFKAERYSIGACGVGPSAELAQNALNLPAVLQVLQNHPARYDLINQHMRDVFPSVRRITVLPIANYQCEIRIWNVDPRPDIDLTVSLADSGTGLVQVLSILYVAVTSDAGRTIIIDEPNSFLHPGAARKLIEILKGYPQQYIISTHSAEIIGISEPQTLNLISWAQGESHIQALNAAEVADIRRALLEVGARLSDVMGADCILWVEGPTEEVCVPKILGQMSGGLPLGTVVVAVRNTGDLESRRPSAKAILEVYERLTSAKALLPRVIAFSFDREGRTDDEMADLARRSKGLVHFLPRRSYENYLLHSRAITEVLNAQPSFRDAPISVVVVEDWLRKHGGDAKYRAASRWADNLSNPDWINEVRAAELLEDLFLGLSEAKEEYRKTTHSVAITEWLLQNDPEHLRELAEYLRKLLAGDTKREQGSTDKGTAT